MLVNNLGNLSFSAMANKKSNIETAKKEYIQQQNLLNQKEQSNSIYFSSKPTLENILLKTNSILSFGNNPSNKLESALEYVKDVHHFYNTQNSGEKLTTLSQLDPKKIDGILDGIELFKNTSTEDLYLLAGLSDTLMRRGCSNGCSHCFIMARGGEKKDIKWNDFKKMADGIGELINRLGFNPFLIFNSTTKKFSYYDISFYPFLDSDPISIASPENNGQKKHNVAEAAEYFYSKTKIPFLITTAGWDIDKDKDKDKDKPDEENWEQKAASDLVKTMKKNPDAVSIVEISVHPFHKYMEKSIKCKQDGDIEKSDYFRQKYIDRMSNVLVTFLPILKLKKAQISLQFAPELKDDTGKSYGNSIQLAKDIIANVEKECIKRKLPKEDYEFFTKEKDPANNPDYIRVKEIYPKGRAKNLFQAAESDIAFKLDKKSNRSKLVTEGIREGDWWNQEIVDNLVKNIKENNNFLDEIVVSINPANSKDMYLYKSYLEKGLLDKAEEARSKYISKMTNTVKKLLPFFELNKAQINIQTPPQNGFDTETIEKLTTDILNNLDKVCKEQGLSSDKYEFLTKTPDLKNNNYIKHDNYKLWDINLDKEQNNPMLDIINSLKPENRYSFVKQLRKAINTNGDVLINSGERGHFEYQFFKVKDYQLNYDAKDNVTKFDNFESVDIDRSSIKASDAVKNRDQQIEHQKTANQNKKEFSDNKKLQFIA